MNKNTGIIIGVITLIVIIGGIYASQNSKDDAIMKGEGTAEDQMKDEKMMGTGIVLKNGTIMLEEGDKMSPLTQDFMFETGVKVSLTGKVTKKDGTTIQLKEGESAWADGTIMKAGADTMMKKEGETMMVKYSGTVLAGKSALLLDYNKTDYDAAIASDELIVLYFYANWCPICKEETKNALYPAFNELTTDRVVGIRINYKDSDTDKDEENLARQYGIPYQHTKVFVKNGKQILKAPDGWDKARYLMEINKALAQ